MTTKRVDFIMPEEAREYNRDRVAEWRNSFYKRGLTYKKVRGRWQWVQRKTKRRKKKGK